jgi:hypothetical protein
MRNYSTLCVLAVLLCITSNSFSQPDLSGACCWYKASPTGGSYGCGFTLRSTCENTGGTYQGAGTVCSTNGISICLAAICCLQNGPCVEHVSHEQCTVSGQAGPFTRWFGASTCEACRGFSNIRMNSFKAEYLTKDGTMQLSWQLENAYGMGEFYVERSRPGGQFKKIAYVSQEHATNKQYSVIDNYPYEITHYRLVFPTKDATGLSQEITAVAIGDRKMVVLPNPATTGIRVLLNNMHLYETNIIVTDLSGRSVLNKKLVNGQHEINISSLTTGTYIVRATQNGNVFTSRFIKQ